MICFSSTIKWRRKSRMVGVFLRWAIALAFTRRLRAAVGAAGGSSALARPEQVGGW